MAFLLIYFQLAFYSNVSDAWLFPEKWKRLWVTLAGPYFELVLWTLAVLTWRFTDPDARLHAIALVVVATSAVRTLLNLNPLIKLDGYYLLSDALGIPNLRARAFRYVSGRLPRLWGAPARAPEEPSPRERLIYVSYGLLAGGYSAWLLGLTAWALAGVLTGRYRGTAAVLSAGLLLAVFQSRLKRLIPSPAPAEAWRGLLASVTRPVKLLVALGAVLAVLFLARVELTVSGEFTVASRRNAPVHVGAGGIEAVIAEIAVPEGEIGDVRVGQPVVLRARALPEKSFVGRVTAIAPPVVRVTTVADNPDLSLEPGMSGRAKIYCGERRIGDLLTLQRIGDFLTRGLARFLRRVSWW